MRKKVLLLAAGICMPLAGLAQSVIDLSANPYSKTNRQVELSLPPKMEYEKSVLNGNTIYTPKQNKVKTQAGTASVTFTYGIEAGEAIPLGMSIYNKEQGVLVIDKTGKNATFTMEIPYGTYDMHAMFKGNPVGNYIVFKENVAITKDTTLVFKKADANQPFTYTNYNEKGEKIKLDLYGTNGGIVTPGNVYSSNYTSYTFFTLEGIGVVQTVVGGGYRVQGYDVDLYTNKTSDRFKVLCHIDVIDYHDIAYFYNFEFPLTNGKDLVSDYKNLKLYEQKFCPTPIGKPKDHIWAFNVWISNEGSVLLNSRTYDKYLVPADSTIRFYIDMPEPANQKGFAVAVSAQMGDLNKNNQFKYMIGLPVTGNAASGLRYIDYGYEQDFDGYLIPEGGGKAQVYPGHPRFSFTDKYNYIFGNTCPILSVKSKDYSTTSAKLLTYLGRYGEVIESDLTTVNEQTETDGDFLKHTYTQENVKVDDVTGKNITVLRHLSKGEDISAPSLQMLRFVDKKDRITDRFDNIEDATLEFAASDFKYHHDKLLATKCFYEHKPLQSVEVSCASHGTENWQAITVAEVPELFYMPAFGYFYKASLANVDVKEDGWFDLKVVLTDQAGNTNTQTLMPAFYSKMFIEPSGVNDVVNAKGGIKYAGGIISVTYPSQIAIFSIDGKCVATANGDSVATDALSQGAYVVKAVDANGNVQTMKFVK